MTFKFLKIIFTGWRLQIKWLWEYFSIGLNISKSKLKFIKGVQCTAVQAGTPINQECHPPQEVRVHAEQARQPLQEDHLLRHRLEDLLCRDAEYLPALGQLSRVTNYDRDNVDRDREREKDMENFTKMLEDSFNNK